MNKLCKLCDGHYNFDSLVIDKFGNEIRIAFPNLSINKL